MLERTYEKLSDQPRGMASYVAFKMVRFSCVTSNKQQ